MTLKHEFLNAGSGAEQLEAAVSDLLAQKLYLEWGIAEIEGLRIDGQRATASLLAEKGPEALSNELAAAVKTELHLSETERKNS